MTVWSRTMTNCAPASAIRADLFFIDYTSRWRWAVVGDIHGHGAIAQDQESRPPRRRGRPPFQGSWRERRRSLGGGLHRLGRRAAHQWAAALSSAVVGSIDLPRRASLSRIQASGIGRNQ